jgi:hypothetical protein
MIAFCREPQAHNYWDSIVGLYRIWRPRLSKAEMEYIKDILESKIKSLNDDRIVPIGVNQT